MINHAKQCIKKDNNIRLWWCFLWILWGFSSFSTEKDHEILGILGVKPRHVSPWHVRPDLLLQVVATFFRGPPPSALQPQLTWARHLLVLPVGNITKENPWKMAVEIVDFLIFPFKIWWFPAMLNYQRVGEKNDPSVSSNMACWKMDRLSSSIGDEVLARNLHSVRGFSSQLCLMTEDKSHQNPMKNHHQPA